MHMQVIMTLAKRARHASLMFCGIALPLISPVWQEFDQTLRMQSRVQGPVYACCMQQQHQFVC